MCEDGKSSWRSWGGRVPLHGALAPSPWVTGHPTPLPTRSLPTALRQPPISQFHTSANMCTADWREPRRATVHRSSVVLCVHGSLFRERCRSVLSHVTLSVCFFRSLADSHSEYDSSLMAERIVSILCVIIVFNFLEGLGSVFFLYMQDMGVHMHFTRCSRQGHPAWITY